GPFIVDRTHALTQGGWPLTGVVWGGGKAKDLPGTPVVLAGSVPLLTEMTRGGRREMWLRWRPELSTLQDSPAWPALFYNLGQWRGGSRPELSAVNVRLGQYVARTFATEPGTVALTKPDGRRDQVVVREGKLVIRADQVGTYALELAEGRESFAVNALNRLES